MNSMEQMSKRFARLFDNKNIGKGDIKSDQKNSKQY